MDRISPNSSSHFLSGCFIPTQFTCSSVGIWTPLLKIPPPESCSKCQSLPFFLSLLLVKSVFTTLWEVCSLVYWFNIICKDVCRRLCCLRSPCREFFLLSCCHLVFCVFGGCLLSPCSFPYSRWLLFTENEGAWQRAALLGQFCCAKQLLFFYILYSPFSTLLHTSLVSCFAPLEHLWGSQRGMVWDCSHRVLPPSPTL